MSGLDSTVALGVGLLTVIVALPVIRVWAWCLADLLGNQPGLDDPSRVLWMAMLILASLVGVVAYIGMGPGGDHWDPDMLWWPWKR